MTTDAVRPRADSGFTLIEVLVAMVILAVGLMALEALGIAAATSVESADRKSELTIGATDVMEETIQAVRQDPATAASAESCGTDAGTGLHACSRVDTRTTAPGLPSRSARITVTVSRTADTEERLTISSYVFDPQLPQ